MGNQAAESLGGATRVRPSPLVGASRNDLVKDLVALFDGICASGEPLWVSLEAPSGWGKTRVGKEFYARLAARQRPPRYWPDAISDLTYDKRKVVTPERGREAGSLPEFLWWGLPCLGDERFPEPALRGGLDLVDKHAPFVSIACDKQRGLTERAIARLVEERWQFAQEGLLEATTHTMSAAGAAIPGVGLLALCMRLGTSAARTHRSKKEMVAAASMLGPDTEGLAQDVVEGLREFGRRRFPVVLFVEDLHLADGALLKTLEALMRQGSHVFVVSTMLPGMFENIPGLSDLTVDLGERVLRVRHRELAVSPPFTKGAGLTRLDREDCEEIVRFHYPRADDDAVALLTDLYDNPYALERVCYMGRYQKRHRERGDLHLTARDIDHFVSSTRDVYSEHWEQLPEWLKFRYGLAASISPGAISPAEGRRNHTWNDAVLEEVADSLALPLAADLLGVDAPADAFGWELHIDECLRQWSETDQHTIAAESGRNLLIRETEFTHYGTLERVARVVERDTTPSVHTARTIIALHAQNHINDNTAVARAIAVVLNYLSYDDTAATERAHLYNLYRLLGPTGLDDYTDLRVRFNGIHAIDQSGRPDRAADAFRELHSDAEDRFGPRDFHALRSRRSQAMALSRAGRVDKAIEMLQELVSDESEILGAKDPDTLPTRSDLAVALQAGDRAQEAVVILKKVVDEATEWFGPKNRHTLGWRHNLATALLASGDAKRAVSMFQEVAEAQADVLGERHPQTLASLANRAMALRHVDRVDDAIELSEKVIDARRSVLGNKHPDTLSSRHNLATAQMMKGLGKEAASLLEEVIGDQSRVLGEDHPHTLLSRRVRAQALLIEDVDEAIPLLKQVFIDQFRALEPGHPDTVESRDLLVLALQELGRADEAIAMFTRLDDSAEELDEAHALASRIHLAMVLFATGKSDKAIDMVKTVRDQQSALHGEAHPDVVAIDEGIAEMQRAAVR